MTNNIPDNSTIGGFNFEWDFDIDEYQDWLMDEEREDSNEARNEYIMDNVTFTLTYVDHETFHNTGEYTELSYEGLVENYGESIARQIREYLETSGKSEGFIDKMELFDEEIDINNPQEVDDAAMKILPNGEYHKDVRGFILSNGCVVYTDMEHSECAMIPGVNGTFHFIKLGNIRILPNSIDIGKEPTPEQKRTLAQVINSYADENLYVDFMTNNSEFGVTYSYPNWRVVLNEIDRYFREGIKPVSKVCRENKERNINENMKKTIRLTEKDLNNMVRRVINETMDWSDYDKAERIAQSQDMADAEEFLNTPDASRNFERFPRTSTSRNTNFNSLANGTPQFRQAKSDAEQRRYEREENDTLTGVTTEELRNAFKYVFGFENSNIYDFNIVSTNITTNEEGENCLSVDFNGSGEGIDSVETPSWSFVEVQPDGTFSGQMIISSYVLNMLKRQSFAESRLRKLVRESIKNFIHEEIDTGQVSSAQDRKDKAAERHANNAKTAEIRKKLARLRIQIGEYEDEGKDIAPLQAKIRELKKQAGFVDESVDYTDMDKKYDRHMGSGNPYSPEGRYYQRLESELDDLGENEIKIDPKNKGKFNATKARTGKSTEELTHSKNPLTKKRAIFAQNAKRWKHGK